MKLIPFDSHKDLASVVFDAQTRRLANELKQLVIPWQPHAGCFVWDPDEHINAESPFPHRIYFILSLPRFIDIFGSIEAIAEKLICLPTWHQARLLCQQQGAPDSAVANIWQSQTPLTVGDEPRQIYELPIAALKAQPI